MTVESVESWSAGVTVVSSKAQFADAGPGLRVRSAGVVHGTGCAALTVCTDQTLCSLAASSQDISTQTIKKEAAPLTDDLSCWFGLPIVVIGGVRGDR